MTPFTHRLSDGATIGARFVPIREQTEWWPIWDAAALEATPLPEADLLLARLQRFAGRAFPTQGGAVTLRLVRR